jgi:hypothetical protein
MRSNAARDALLFEFPDHVQYLALAADHGDVAGLGCNRQLEHPHIVAMSASHYDDVAGFIDGQTRKNLFVLVGVNGYGFREALAIGEGFAVIDHNAIETGQGCHLGETLGNVSGAEDEGVGHGH